MPMSNKDWLMDTYNAHVRYCPECREQYIGSSQRRSCFACASVEEQEKAHKDYVKAQFDLNKIK